MEVASPKGSTHKRTRSLFLDHPAIARAQRKHFLLLDALPVILSILSVVYLIQVGLRADDWAVFGFMWVITAFGIEGGHHRLFSHRAYIATKPFKVIMAFLSHLSGQGTIASWASTHRHHHQYSEKDEDTHSPYTGQQITVRSFLKSHFLWKWNYRYPNPIHYSIDILKDKTLRSMDKLYYLNVVSGVLLSGVLNFLLSGEVRGFLVGLAFGGIIRLTLTQHFTWMINSVCHIFGKKNYRTGDESRDNFWLVIPTLGGAWHNTHHAFPNSPRNDLIKKRIDPTYYILKLFGSFGLLKLNRWPTEELTWVKKIDH